jgi:multiple sugar transport system substrate-binding protein
MNASRVNTTAHSMHRSRRSPATRLSAAACVAVLALLLQACSSSPAASSSEPIDPAHPTTVYLVTKNFAGFLKTFPSVIGESFTKRTGITVKIVNSGANPWSSVDQRVAEDQAAGHPDDIATIGIDTLPTYVAAKRVAPLDALMKSSGFDSKSFYPEILGLGKVNGVTYGIPYVVSTMELYYNADVFRKAGLNPDQPPTTFSELQKDALQIVKSKAARYGVSYATDSSDAWPFQNFLLDEGGSMLDPGGTKIAFDSEAGLRALSFWADLYKAGGGEPTTTSDELTAFARGDIGMLLESVGFATQIQQSVNFDVRAAKRPIPAGGLDLSAPGGADLVILSKDPRQQRADFEVIEALTAAAADATVTKNSGYLPVNQQAATDPALLGTYLDQHPLLQPALEQLSDLAPWVAFPGTQSDQAFSILEQEQALALRGAVPAAGALRSAANQIQALLP